MRYFTLILFVFTVSHSLQNDSSQTGDQTWALAVKVPSMSGNVCQVPSMSCMSLLSGNSLLSFFAGDFPHPRAALQMQKR